MTVSEKRTQRREKLTAIDLYPVITEKFCAGRRALEVLDRLLAAGVRIVQLREKELCKRDLFELGLEFRRRTADADCLLIINDHVDVAMALDADGVHLGQADLPLHAARPIAPDLLIGVSTHTLDQALAAQEAGADYVNVGPIYPTGTKPEHQVFLGPEKMGEIGRELSIPFTVMGGIKTHNVAPVLAAGAKHIAVVTAVTAAVDIEGAAKQLRNQIIGSY